MKNRSFIRRALRFVRLLVAIPILRSMFLGKIEWPAALMFYIISWTVFIFIDAIIAYKESGLKKRAARNLSYPLNQLPRNNARK